MSQVKSQRLGIDLADESGSGGISFVYADLKPTVAEKMDHTQIPLVLHQMQLSVFAPTTDLQSFSAFDTSLLRISAEKERCSTEA